VLGAARSYQGKFLAFGGGDRDHLMRSKAKALPRNVTATDVSTASVERQLTSQRDSSRDFGGGHGSMSHFG
jgi:hypothetical protein